MRGKEEIDDFDRSGRFPECFFASETRMNQTVLKEEQQWLAASEDIIKSEKYQS